MELTCSRCKVPKPLSAFHKDKRRPHGVKRQCKSCVAKYTKVRPKPDPERERERDRARYDAEKERRRAAVSAYKAAHPERVKEKDRRVREKYRDYRTALTAQHKADKLRAMPAWADRDAIRQFYREAARLSAETGIPHEVDHIVPLRSSVVCGLHVPANLQCLTKSQNSAKRNAFNPDAHCARLPTS